MTDELTACSRCGDPKPASAFLRSPRGRTGRMGICRDCHSLSCVEGRKWRGKLASVLAKDGRSLHVSEDLLQQQIVEGLTWKGYTVLVTSRRRKRCWHCGEWPKGGDGVTEGCPDLFVTHPSWLTNAWRGMDVKTRTGRASPAQRVLVGKGAYPLVRSLEDALEAVAAGGEPEERTNVSSD